MGIGRTADVDRYLAGAPVDKVSDLDVNPFRLTRDTRPGSATPAPPAEQSFWVAKSGGTYADLDWKISDGSYRLVVMNTDGSRNVSTDADFEITVPNLPEIGIGILTGGMLVLGGGIVLIVVGVQAAMAAGAGAARQT